MWRGRWNETGDFFAHPAVDLYDGCIYAVSFFLMQCFREKQKYPGRYCILFVLAVFQISRMNSVIYTIIFYTIFACSEVAYEIIYRMLSNVLSFPMTPWYEQESAGFFLTEYFFKFLLLLFPGKVYEEAEDRATE